MKAYGMYQGWVLKEIDGVQIDGKTYSVEQIKAALEVAAKTPSPQPNVAVDQLADRVVNAIHAEFNINLVGKADNRRLRAAVVAALATTEGQEG